jgi:hypothetical protein
MVALEFEHADEFDCEFAQTVKGIFLCGDFYEADCSKGLIV